MEYFSPRSLSETLTLLRTWKGEAKLIAGGTDIIPAMRKEALSPQALIDLSHLKNLGFIKEEKNRIRVGSLTTISEIASSNMIQRHASILVNAANQLGNPLVRNRATIAGNLTDASPAADTAVPLLALEASVITVRSAGKGRKIPIDRFFAGPHETILKKDEMIKEIICPKPHPKAKGGYSKLGLRNAMAISVVSVAILLEMEEDKCRKVRIALGAVAPTPIRAYRTEKILADKKVSKELVDACCDEVVKEVSPITDIRASAEYRREMASVLLKRVIRQVTS
jgi:CO/xanthine dehydrogenase FAD-binding subunit